MTSLKINLSTSTIIGVGRDQSATAQIASDSGCHVDNFPFVYLGNPLGGRIDCSGWDPLVDMF